MSDAETQPQLPVQLFLTLEEVRGVLGLLQKLPYEQSAQLIDKIRFQAAHSIKTAGNQAPAAPATPTAPKATAKAVTKKKASK